MTNIRIKKIRGRSYLYSRKTNSEGRTVEEYLGPVERVEHPRGVHCPRCGKRISDDVIRTEIVSSLKKAHEKMWKEKRHISNYAQYELLEVLIDAFADAE